MKSSRSHKSVLSRLLAVATFFISATLITGCGANFVSSIASPNPALHPPIYGNLHGGQQPVVGASIQLYAAGAPSIGGGYGQGSIPLILLSTLPVTDQNGNFTITGDYTAPLTPSFFYIVATGGSPGVGQPINPNITMMTTIGGCNPTVGLSPSTSVEINEVTTAATALALQQYLAAPSLTNIFSPAIGAPSTDIIGLQNAFQAVNNLVSTETGVVVDPSTNAYASSDNGLLLNTMGDILASCVNSAPLLDTSCFNLYANATPTGLAFPSTDTDQAASYMARNPTNNVPALFGLIPAKPPFIPSSTAPAAFAVTLTNLNSSCQAPINLNSLDHFELLAGSTITAAQGTTTTEVSGGDLGLSPGTAVTGFGTGPAELVTPGVMYIGTDPIAQQAQLDFVTAYNQVALLPGAAPLPADISGYILPPGLYSSTSTLAFSTNITLDAQGDSSAQFIFQVGSGLNTAGNTQIILLNGAQAKNIFWQVSSAAVLGGSSVFEGSILAHASITLNTGTVLHGRALASVGAVSMAGSNVVSKP